MMRTAGMLVGVIVASASIWAQTPASESKTAISVTGCVAPVQRDGSLAAKPAVTPPPPELAPYEANNPEPTGRFMLLDATTDTTDASAAKEKPAGQETAATSGAKPERTSYTLRGHEQELAKHQGHRVQVVGTLMPPLTATLPAQAAKSAEGIRAVQVTSIKMIGTDCSPTPPPQKK